MYKGYLKWAYNQTKLFLDILSLVAMVTIWLLWITIKVCANFKHDTLPITLKNNLNSRLD